MNYRHNPEAMPDRDVPDVDLPRLSSHNTPTAADVFEHDVIRAIAALHDVRDGLRAAGAGERQVRYWSNLIDDAARAAA